MPYEYGVPDASPVAYLDPPAGLLSAAIGVPADAGSGPVGAEA
jgi:hypothetical protein